MKAVKQAGKYKSRMAKLLVIAAAAMTIAAGLFFSNPPTDKKETAPEAPPADSRPLLERLRIRREKEPKTPRADQQEPNAISPIVNAPPEDEYAPIPGCKWDPLNNSGVCELGWACPDHPRNQMISVSLQRTSNGTDAHVTLPEDRRSRPGLWSPLKSARAIVAAPRRILRDTVTDKSQEPRRRPRTIASRQDQRK